MEEAGVDEGGAPRHRTLRRALLRMACAAPVFAVAGALAAGRSGAFAATLAVLIGPCCAAETWLIGRRWEPWRIELFAIALSFALAVLGAVAALQMAYAQAAVPELSMNAGLAAVKDALQDLSNTNATRRAPIAFALCFSSAIACAATVLARVAKARGGLRQPDVVLYPAAAGALATGPVLFATLLTWVAADRSGVGLPFVLVFAGAAWIATFVVLTPVMWLLGLAIELADRVEAWLP